MPTTTRMACSLSILRASALIFVTHAFGASGDAAAAAALKHILDPWNALRPPIAIGRGEAVMVEKRGRAAQSEKDMVDLKGNLPHTDINHQEHSLADEA